MKRAEGNKKENTNPILRADFPDADVIRVGDTYYMLTSTLHFLPGAEILRSYDLKHWEIASFVFDTFEGTEEARMKNEKNNYGYGMWAGSLQYHNGRFYVSFAAKETCKTYFYTANKIEGPWKGTCLNFYFHHGCLFFDEDDRVYLIFGHNEIWIREMLPDLSGLKPGGFARKLLTDSGDVWVPYEGAHFQKIDGTYYLFVVRWPKDGTARRTQYCFTAKSLEEEFTGGPVFDDNGGFFNSGIAKGGLVQDNDGAWYAVLMQDRGALGRCPMLVPVTFQNGQPVFGRKGKAPRVVETTDNRPHYAYEPLYTSDSFAYETDENGHCTLGKQWQWNHEPSPELWSIDPEGGLRVVTGKVCANMTQAVNTLTQRLFAPAAFVEVTVDASDLNDGDFAGLAALLGCYRMLAVTSELRRYHLVLMERKDSEKNRNTTLPDYLPGEILEKISLRSPIVRIRMEADFKPGAETVTFYYREPMEGGKWRKIGGSIPIYFGLDHFAGCRAGLSVYASKKPGGSACFKDFVYEMTE